MDRKSAVAFAGEARIHIALEVSDLERSISFYRLLFGVEPVKVRPGYAKFEPTTPSVNLSLNQGAGGSWDRLGGSPHFGVQVQSSDAVRALAERFAAAGSSHRIEAETACCYSVQDKVWVDDPDGNPWEVFVVVQAESERRAPAGSTCCVPTPRGGDLAAAAAGACC